MWSRTVLTRLSPTTAIGVVISVMWLPFADEAKAQTATWIGGTSSDYHTDSNWSPAAVPNSTAIDLLFGPAALNTTISALAGSNAAALVFEAGASSFVFNIGPAATGFGLHGDGIVNNSGVVQTINLNNAGLIMNNNASMGGNIVVNLTGTGQIDFKDTSSGGLAAFNLNGSAGVLIDGSNHAVSMGSLSGTGFRIQFSGPNQSLTVGGNNQSTSYSGQLWQTSSGTNASLIKVGTGTLTLSGTTNYSGGTTISGGTLSVSSNGHLGASSGALTLNGGALRVTGTTFNSTSRSITLGSLGGGIDIANAANNLSILQGISGPGGLTKTGAGTLRLQGNNTYAGATTVSAGRLLVNGSIASSSLTTVEAGATLGGNGTVGNTMINGGTLSPGNSIGALTVAGNLVLTAASTYMVEVSPTASDFTHVTGSAALGGATVAAQFAPGTYVGKRYTILTADGGVSGTFSGPVNTNLPTNFNTTLAYDGSNAYLDLNLNFVMPSGLNRNQQAVATTLTNFFNSTGGIPLAFGALSPQGLTQVSGELATGTQQATFNAMGLFIGVMTDPFMAGRGGDGASVIPTAYADDTSALGYAANGRRRSASERDAYAAIYRKAPPPAPTFGQRWNVWAAGFGGSQTTDGNSVVGSNTATSSVYGGAVGADYRISPDTLVGFAMAGGGTQFRVDSGFGTGRSDLFQVGVNARHRIGNAYLSGALAYGWQDITTDRIVTANGIERLRANFNANAFSGRLEGGYRIATSWLGITPYAAGQFTSYDLPAYAEQSSAGGNLFALSYAAKNATASRSELGVRTDKSFALNDAILTLRGRAAWAHNFDTDRSIAVTFQSLPGASFVVNGAAQARDAALVTAAAEMTWANGFAAAATFEGEFSNTTESYAGKGVLKYSW